jgi:Icc-related predicted phosphoesterase
MREETMRLVCLSDIHNRLSAMQQILDDAGPADAVVLAGDLTHFGEPADAETIVRLAGQQGSRVLAVAGNCDSRAIDVRLAELGVSLMRTAAIQQDAAFYGLSAMPVWMRSMYELTEDELAEALQAGRAQLDGKAASRFEVLVSHSPPRGCSLDVTGRGEHVGSTAVREWIERVAPSLVISGHIHEARGSETIGTTQVVNCGPAYEGCYAIVTLADPIEVELRQAASVEGL